MADELEKTCENCRYEDEDMEGTHCRHCIHNAIEHFEPKVIVPTEQEIRAKAINEFAERIALEISESIIWGMLPTDCKDGVSDEIVDYVIDTSKKIAEQMKIGGIDG